MRFWRALWELIHTWQGLALAVLAGLGTIYYGPRKVLETWDWYLDRFLDRKVMDTITIPKAARLHASSANFGQPAPREAPYEIYELAHLTGRSEACVGASLRRLHKRGKITFTHDGKWIRKEHS